MKVLTEKNDEFWLRLDNAAKIFAAIKGRDSTSVFRVSVLLKERVRIQPFLEAIKSLEDRFPYYKVKLEAGVFWYYLQKYEGSIPVVVDDGIPCRGFKKNEFLFRVLVKSNRISVEFSHVLTDGGGALEFLQSILLVYFQHCKKPIVSNLSFLSPDTPVHPEEFEDAYKKYFQTGLPGVPGTTRAFHLPYETSKNGFDILTSVVAMEQIIAKAKEHEVSLTEYLTAVYLLALQEIFYQQSAFKRRRSKKGLRIQVPVNLRKIYPSKTMRNFALFVRPGIDLRLGHYTFEEIVKTVHHQMQFETDKKLINKIISRNVGGEKNWLVRGVPLFFKSWILRFFYEKETTRYSGIVTNLGRVNLQGNLNELIDHFSVAPPPPNEIQKVGCGVIGFGNKLVLSFSNITDSKELEQKILSFLTGQGIHVKIINEDSFI
jgi:NRPS condensation-like uncharacterized protein